MENLVSDTNTYFLQNIDPTLTIQNKIYNIITVWYKNKYISTADAKNLKTYHFITPKVYGLPEYIFTPHCY